ALRLYFPFARGNGARAPELEIDAADLCPCARRRIECADLSIQRHRGLFPVELRFGLLDFPGVRGSASRLGCRRQLAGFEAIESADDELCAERGEPVMQAASGVVFGD